MVEVDALMEIRRKLDQARVLAVDIDVFNIFYMIEAVLFETNDMLYRGDVAKDESNEPLAGIDDSDEEDCARERAPRRARGARRIVTDGLAVGSSVASPDWQ